MIFPVVFAQGTEVAGSAGVTPGLPAGLQNNDILILTCESANEAFSTPSGYTSFATASLGPLGGGESARMHVFWKRVVDAASEAAPTVADPGNHVTARIHGVRGCTPHGLPFEPAVGGTSFEIPLSVVGDTTTVANCLVVICAVHGADTSAANFSNWANADLANVTERGDSGNTSGNGGGIACATGEKASAGAYGATTADMVLADNWAAITLALKPAGGSIPTFQAVGSLVGAATGVTVAWPTHAVDDIALLIVEGDTTAPTLTTANGFVETADSPKTSGANLGLRSRIAVFWCRATSTSMASPVVADAGDHTIGRIFTFRGVVATGDPWDVTSGEVAANPVRTDVFVPSITTLGPDRLVMGCVAASPDTLVDQFSGWTNGNLANLTEIHDHFTDAGGGGGQGVFTGEMAVAGATGVTTATLASVGGFACVIFALIPEPPPLPRRHPVRTHLARSR